MDIEFKVVCRNCGYKNRKIGSEVEDRISINCRNCGHRNVVDTGKLQANLLNVERAVKDSHLIEFSAKFK